MREIPNSLGANDETTEEYVKRLEDIVKNWHKRHTSMSYKLKQHIKARPKKIPAWNPTEDYDGYYIISDIDDWFEQLKIIVEVKV